ncbi:5'/3'-nucleotidase SurE [Pseudooceanicola sp. CBS1P-1]|uniref:5'-nucleotidase SurE n=1 Tax=Pseudooceanicola albus TaxID=2692189 RepID=A0A6L7G0J0_9RHOB|nr:MULTISPECIES: 5'/3'-nucleotidase SurE [Pseudooceanicola]MBT9382499.1 5'/3'-nucleotidase SurE [Pseudooceanicola endophyticus]MXN17040.1 5'/3'-nucleotidase SurE [Pseudooceanicola albus]
MRILITNDDGINAPGLATLEAIAAEVAGPEGEVWVVAPAFEQSGVAHCISYTHPTMISQMGERRFAAEGSPADCVLAGVHDVLEGQQIDLVLSGVNRGNNSGENAVYSGTLGGAMEGALQGLPAIALSQYFGAGNRDLDDPFEAAAAHGAALVREILALHRPAGEKDYNTFYNVNFPACPADQVKGRKVTPQGLRTDFSFAVSPQVAPSGRRFLWARSGNQQSAALPGSDVEANLSGYISVTPMRADLTAHDLLDGLKGLE